LLLFSEIFFDSISHQPKDGHHNHVPQDIAGLVQRFESK